jgi:hypothetical protein
MEEAGVAPDLAGEVMAVVGTLEPAFEKVAKARKMIADMD